MCLLECFTCFALCRSRKRVCGCCDFRHATCCMSIIEVMELGGSIALLVYLSFFSEIIYAQVSLLVIGNLVPLILRIIASIISGCDAQHRKRFRVNYHLRLAGLLLYIAVLITQIVISCWLISDLAFYDGRLDFGLCTFCNPSDCQSDYQVYQDNQNSNSRDDTEGQGYEKIWNQLKDAIYFSGDYETYDQFIHRGVSQQMCQVFSVILMLPFLLWAFWHLHFVVVAKQRLIKKSRIESTVDQIEILNQDYELRRRAELMMLGFRDDPNNERQPRDLDYHTQQQMDRGPISRNNQENEQSGGGVNTSQQYHTLNRVESIQSGLGHLPPSEDRTTIEERPITSRREGAIATRDTVVRGQIPHPPRIVSREGGVGRMTAENWFNKQTRTFYKEKEVDDAQPFYMVKTRKESVVDIEETEKMVCAICFEVIQNNQKIVELRCQHLFHPECSKDWVVEKKRCPVCRLHQFRRGV